MEEVDLDAAAPWTETTTITKISAAPKDEAAKFHNIAVQALKESKKALLCYSDGSMREGNVGAGAVVYAMNGEVIEKAIPMGREAEVYDAELEGMKVAARMAVRECNRTPNEIESVHIVTLGGRSKHGYSIEDGETSVREQRFLVFVVPTRSIV